MENDNGDDDYNGSGAGTEHKRFTRDGVKGSPKCDILGQNIKQFSPFRVLE